MPMRNAAGQIWKNLPSSERSATSSWLKPSLADAVYGHLRPPPPKLDYEAVKRRMREIENNERIRKRGR
jgi:hypothetical protein